MWGRRGEYRSVIVAPKLCHPKIYVQELPSPLCHHHVSVLLTPCYSADAAVPVLLFLHYCYMLLMGKSDVTISTLLPSCYSPHAIILLLPSPCYNLCATILMVPPPQTTASCFLLVWGMILLFFTKDQQMIFICLGFCHIGTILMV